MNLVLIKRIAALAAAAVKAANNPGRPAEYVISDARAFKEFLDRG
jgi:hypothetical protein